jgi:hypothetical protein
MTAVEFLLEKYKSQNTLLFAEDWQQAKEMEKEQIVEAYDNICSDEHGNILTGEQYYNETFKSE